MKVDREIQKHRTSTGIVVYRLPVLAFPKHVTNCYLVLDDPITLIDCGSGWKDSNKSLVDCFDRLHAECGENIGLKDVDRLIITHGHIDHFGGANFFLDETEADVWIHELDSSVLMNFEERLIVSSKDLHVFMNRTGLEEKHLTKLIGMNKWSKGTFQPIRVDRAFSGGPLEGSPFYVHHTPGHCPGQVCLQLDDILFTADHILSRITPHQSPEAITRNMGVGHYLASLAKIRALDGIRLGLGGHEDPIEDVAARIDETVAFHGARLQKTYDICAEPKTLTEISLELFGKRDEYHVLLAILETGAHVEYLYERGRLQVANHREIEDQPNPVLKYAQMANGH